MQQWVFSGSCIDYEEEFSIQKDPVALTDKGKNTQVQIQF